MPLVISVEDPDADDARALLEIHHRFSYDETPADYVFVLPAEGLAEPDVTFFGARRHGLLVAMGALRRIDATHAELKSMHVRESERRTGIGRELLVHLLDAARQAGFRRVSLETGTMEAYAPARALYAGAGFRPCDAFGEYEPSPYNTFMTLELGG